MKFLASEVLSENRKMTPQGYLLCTNVPIARIGDLTYQSKDIYNVPSDDGKVIVTRDEETLFNDKTLASFNGMPFTVHHPPAWDNEAMVDSENWKKYAAGFVQCARRGTGADSDLLMADILVQDKEAVDLINNGFRELSVGYTADFIPLGTGRAAQRNFRGNHVALVMKGRAGPRCAVRDSLENEEVNNVAKKNAVIEAFKTLIHGIGLDEDIEIKSKSVDEDIPKDGAVTDEDDKKCPKCGKEPCVCDEKDDPSKQRDEDVKEPDNPVKDEDPNDPHNPAQAAGEAAAVSDEVVKQIQACIEALSQRIKRVEDFAAKLGPLEEKEHGTELIDEGDPKDKPEEKKEEYCKCQDEADMNSFVEKIGILLDSSIELPDPATDSVEDIDKAICEGKRKVLSKAMENPNHKTIIDAVIGQKAIDSLTPEEINTAFRTACVSRHTTAKDSAFLENVVFANPDMLKDKDEHKKLMTGADLGELYKNHWKTHGGMN